MLFPDNEGEDKHVESKLIPRLDESSNLSISAKRSASEKLVDLFPFYGETADRFCSMGATMSCSMAAADCFFVAYCRCP